MSYNPNEPRDDAGKWTEIGDLTRKLNLGSHPSQGVKAVLGKNPINMSSSRLDSVLAELRTRYEATPQGQAEKAPSKAWNEDMPRVPGYKGPL